MGLTFAAATAIGALSPLEVPVVASAWVVAGGLWFMWILVRGDANPVRTPLLLCSLVFSLACLLGLAAAPEPDGFAVTLALAPLGAALVASLAADTRSRRIAVDAFVALLAILALLSLRLWATGATSTVTLTDGEATARYFPASFGHPNQYAAALILLLPFALARVVMGGGWQRRLAATAMVLGLASLYLTYSRGFWLGFLVSCTVVLTSRNARLGFLAALGVVIALFGPQLGERIFSSDTVNNSRLDIWGRAVTVITDHPLLGVGVGNFGWFSGDTVLPDTAAPPPHAHNFVLSTASEVGLVGTAALIGALILVASALLRSGRRPLPVDDRVARVGCMGALLGAATGGLFDGVVYHNAQTLFIAASVSGLAAALSYARDEGAEAGGVRKGQEPGTTEHIDEAGILRARIAAARKGE